MSQNIEYQDSDWVRAIFSVVWEPGTYLNLLYLLISLPLGIFYFVFLTTGFALGLGLAIIWIGLPILLLMILAVYGLTGFERLLAIHLLAQEVVPLREPLPQESAWQWLRGVLTTPATWKGLLFLLLKLPFGIFSFTMTVILLSLSLAFVLAPVLVLTGGVLDFELWVADTLPEALLCTILGFILLLVSLHVLNALAWLWGFMARALLGKSFT